MSDSGLSKSIGPLRGTALMLNIVVGAGLLSLPGLAIQQVGSLSMAAWLLCAAASVPLLVVFIMMGRRFPDAGGVAHFGRQAFGPIGYAIASVLFFGAVIFGLPSIALTGGHYAAAMLGGPPHLYAAILILAGTLANIVSAEMAGRFNALMASMILGVIIILLVAGFAGYWNTVPVNPPRLPSESEFVTVLTPFMMLFFAFTGFEVGAGMTGEFRNPKRDIPIAMGCAFILATALYIAIAYLAQKIDLTGNFASPFVSIIRPVFGEFGAAVVAVTAVLLILANLSAAIWGVSRMVFSAAGEAGFVLLQKVAAGGTPVNAVLTVVSALVGVVALDAAGYLGMDRMLALAGQNFLIIYGIAAAALFVTSPHVFDRVASITAIAITAVLLFLNARLALYPAILCAFAGIIAFVRTNKTIISRAA